MNLGFVTNTESFTLQEEGSDGSDEESSGESDEDEFPDDGYDVEKKKMKGVVNYFLVHTESKRKVNIGGEPDSGEWEVYIDHEDDNREYIWHGQDGEMEAQLCSEAAVGAANRKPSKNTPMSERGPFGVHSLTISQISKCLKL